MEDLMRPDETGVPWINQHAATLRLPAKQTRANTGTPMRRGDRQAIRWQHQKIPFPRPDQDIVEKA
jgi:hypothetical protein